nr:venom protein [Lampona murina]
MKISFVLALLLVEFILISIVDVSRGEGIEEKGGLEKARGCLISGGRCLANWNCCEGLRCDCSRSTRRPRKCICWS